MKSKQELKEIFESWIHDQVDNWLYEYVAWDDKIEDGEITEEELEVIQSSFVLDDVIVNEREV